MDALLGLIWFFGTLTAGWFAIRPSPKVMIFANRRRAAITAAAIFIGAPVLAALLRTPGTVPPPQASATGDATTKSDVGDDEVRTTSVASTSSSQPTKVDNPPAPASKWAYNETTDSMRGTVTKLASVESNESFANSLGFGRETTSLTVHRRAARTEISLNNPHLQFTCSSFTSTHVSAKFDDGPVQRFGCTDAKGNTFGVAFILSEAKFLSELKKAKRLVIEAEIFQKGDTQMTFDVSGLAI